MAEVNVGVAVQRATGAAPDATIVVTGVGRSGTSMAAAVVAALGIPLGSPTAEGLYEDAELRHALLYFFHDRRAQRIARLNAAHASWGFKFPSLHRHMQPPELGQFRSPRIVCVWRDVLAVAQRSAALRGFILDEQRDFERWVDATPCPVLHISYEKAMAEPRSVAGAIAAFIGKPLREEAIEVIGKKGAYLAAEHEA